jgi:hypothetical protein
MATPAYSGGGYHRRGWGGGRRWVHAPTPTDNGWLDRVSAWFDGTPPRYSGAGQPVPGAGGGGAPVYQAPPPTTATADAATTTPQTAPSVIVASRT